MIYAVPGGPVAVIVGENATPEQIAAATEQFGLDRPVLVQYADWLGERARRRSRRRRSTAASRCST